MSETALELRGIAKAYMRGTPAEVAVLKGADLTLRRGEVVALKYYGPAHTGGDSVVTFEKANVVHMGDLVFNRRHPFIDRPGGASSAGWITVLEQAVADHQDDTIYIFGHAGQGFPVTGSKADLLYMRDYLSALLDYVRGEMKERPL